LELLANGDVNPAMVVGGGITRGQKLLTDFAIFGHEFMIVGTRQIYCRKIPVILKYSVIIIRTPWINLIYMLGQSYGVFRQIFFTVYPPVRDYEFGKRFRTKVVLPFWL
jgi:hypothetical protein